MLKSARLQQEAQVAIASAKAIAQTAVDAGREMTGEETAEYRKHFDLASDLNEQRKAALADEQVIVQAKALSDELGLGPAAKDDLDAQTREPERTGRKSLGRQVVESTTYKSLLTPFQGRDESGLVRIPEKARIESAPINFKSLFTGASVTSGGAFVTSERTDIIEMLGRRPLTLRNLISVRTTASDTVEYVVQTSHTNNAAMVPEATSTGVLGDGTGGTATLLTGGYKPEGAWAFARRTATVRTIAEWVPATKRALADAGQLEGLINDELEVDLAEKEEDAVLRGDGQGENLLGILGTSGIQTQAKGADTLFDAVRKALTKARTIGRVAPSGIVVNPVEAEKIDTAKDTQGRYFGLGPFGIGPRTLWGVPVVESEAMTAGTALLGDFSKAVLWDREQSSVTMTDSHADFFIRNLVAILAEERVAFGVTRPSAFVTVTGL